MKAGSKEELDKSYRYVARALADSVELLDFATDIYGLRNEVFGQAA